MQSEILRDNAVVCEYLRPALRESFLSRGAPNPHIRSSGREALKRAVGRLSKSLTPWQLAGNTVSICYIYSSHYNECLHYGAGGLQCHNSLFTSGLSPRSYTLPHHNTRSEILRDNAVVCEYLRPALRESFLSRGAPNPHIRSSEGRP
ncbi:hypothetical protein GPALN_001851 [Globodera pallida]|nr:hypothetical protein GPALN_001851 [Globodera pallida]